MTHGRRGGHDAAPSANVVVGRRQALEAVRSGSALEILVAAGSRPTAGLREVRAAARASGVAVREVPVEEVAAMAGASRHQGVAARVAAPDVLSEADLGREWTRDALVLVLDGVTDPQNVGALARTAEAFGSAALVVRRRRGSGRSPAAVRASAGALLHLPVAEVANVPRCLTRLKEADFWVVGLDVGATRTLHAAQPPPGRLALVVGSEGLGLSRLVREACDELLAIPLHGRVSSLNVSVATGIGLFWLAGGRDEGGKAGLAGLS